MEMFMNGNIQFAELKLFRKTFIKNNTSKVTGWGIYPVVV
jgi:hypothetical protein